MRNNLSKKLFCSAALLLAAALAGCTGSESIVPPSRGRTEPSFWEKSSGILKRYDSFYIPPIEAFTVEGDKLRRVQQTEAENLAESFRAKIIQRLGDRYSVLPQPARNVAIIKVAISDVSTNYALFQLLPGYVVPNPMRGGASIQADFLDSISNQPVAIFHDSRQGARQGFLSGLGKWDGVEKAFDEWAQLLVSNIRR